MSRRAALLLALLVAPADPAAAQGARPRVAAGVRPDTVTVGDRFELRVRISLPPGWRAELPEGLPASAAVQSLAGVRTERSPGAANAVYPLVAWTPGEPRLPPLRLPVWAPDGRPDTLLLSLPLPVVRSVLPADTAGLRPRPPKPILPDSRARWPLALALLAALVGAFAGARAWRRRHRPQSPPPVAEPRHPRSEALLALDEARRRSAGGAALMESTTGVLRGYLDVLSSRWGSEATTAELVPRLRDDGAPAAIVEELAALLAAGDRVKFAAADPAPGEAEAHWGEARAWVAEFAPPRSAAPVGVG